jgi:hypothetical protein
MTDAHTAAARPEVSHQKNAVRSLQVKWGGVVLAVCAGALTVIALLYGLVYGAPPGTGEGGAVTLADRVGHLQDHWRLAATLWRVEVLAWAGLGLAGFVLSRRAPAGPWWLPARASWIAAAMGALTLALMCAVMLGGYPAAAAAFEAVPALFEMLNEVAISLFALGNVVLYLGLGGAFVAEGASDGVLARWVARIGAAACCGMSVLSVLLLMGTLSYGELLLGIPLALLGFALTTYLGGAIYAYE